MTASSNRNSRMMSTALRTLPLPPYVLRELWIRTQNERAYRRFYVLADTTAEIEENTREGYRNTHYREAYWKKAPFRIVIPLRKDGTGRETPVRKPRKTLRLPNWRPLFPAGVEMMSTPMQKSEEKNALLKRGSIEVFEPAIQKRFCAPVFRDMPQAVFRNDVCPEAFFEHLFLRR